MFFYYRKLFIGDRNVSRRHICSAPFGLNDTVVSEVDRLITIRCKRFEPFFNKSRIDVFVIEPAPIGFAFTTFFFGHRFLVL